MQNITVTEPGRIDAVIAKSQNLSRSFVNVLLDQGKVQLGDKPIYKASVKVKEGDIINLNYTPDALKEIPDITLPILYQDDDCIVINKPEGVLTHSKGVFNPEATVSSFIRPFTTGMEDNRGGIVHRLDRVTSGVLIAAKHEKALQWLQNQFAERKAHKTYLAVVQGTLKESAALIDMPIERNPKKPQTFRVGAGGKHALTSYKVLSSNETYSLVELRPQTGRTHQLRVHMSQLGHPIVGDVLYGGEPAARTYLHAQALQITIPSNQTKTFEAPVPESFHKLVS